MEYAYIDAIGIGCLVPSRIEPRNTTREVCRNSVTRIRISRILRYTVVNGINGFDKFLFSTMSRVSSNLFASPCRASAIAPSRQGYQNLCWVAMQWSPARSAYVGYYSSSGALFMIWRRTCILAQRKTILWRSQIRILPRNRADDDRIAVCCHRRPLQHQRQYRIRPGFFCHDFGLCLRIRRFLTLVEYSSELCHEFLTSISVCRGLFEKEASEGLVAMKRAIMSSNDLARSTLITTALIWP